MALMVAAASILGILRAYSLLRVVLVRPSHLGFWMTLLGGASNLVAEVESGHVESSLLGACDHSVRYFIVSFSYRTLMYRSDPIASIEWFAPMLMDIANTAAG